MLSASPLHCSLSCIQICSDLEGDQSQSRPTPCRKATIAAQEKWAIKREKGPRKPEASSVGSQPLLVSASFSSKQPKMMSWSPVCAHVAAQVWACRAHIIREGRKHCTQLLDSMIWNPKFRFLQKESSILLFVPAIYAWSGFHISRYLLVFWFV